MVSTPRPSGESLVYDVRLSSVVPASITGENRTHELTNMDLIMKLHYIKGIYFFHSSTTDAADDDHDDDEGRLRVSDFKKSMCECLVLFYTVSGRIRMSENGRPYIKCNDSGVRVVEAKCTKTLDQWLRDLESINDHSSSLNDQLIYTQFLGPDLSFTPLVFVQFTWFKCGGLSIGLSWAHILGDALSASQFINMWGQTMAGQVPTHHLDIRTNASNDNSNNKVNGYVSPVLKVPSSIQKIQLGPAGDQWLISNRCKMQNHSFNITAERLNDLTQKSKSVKTPFEVISAVIWKSLAKVRGKSSEPKNVTICKRNHALNLDEEINISNSRVTIWTVEAVNLKGGAVGEADLSELANLFSQENVDETSRVEEVAVDDGKSHHDFILYGANLTFVNWEDVKIYGLELKGQKPVFANFGLSGVGDEGAILVLPGRLEDGDRGREKRGRMVNLILPDNHMEDLKQELRNEWRIF